MKRIFAMLLCVLLSISLVACAAPAANDETAPTPTATPAPTQAGEVSEESPLPSLNPGEYVTNTYGHNGNVTLKVTTDAASITAIAVSYTHLDVYKRQHHTQ